MTKSFSIETTADEWGHKTYKIKMLNSTNLVFDYFMWISMCWIKMEILYVTAIWDR